MSFLVTRYKIYNFTFIDPTFNCSYKRIHEFFRLIAKNKKLNKKITWEIQTRANLSNIMTLKLMKQAGCTKISFGIETASKNLLDRMQKGLTLEQYYKSCYLVKKSGIKLEILLIHSFPKETESDVDETIEMIKKIKPDSVVLSNFYPVIGSTEYKMIVKGGKIISFDKSRKIGKEYVEEINNKNYTNMSDETLNKKLYEIKNICNPIQFKYVFNNLSYPDKVRFLFKLENINKFKFYLKNKPRYFIKLLLGII